MMVAIRGFEGTSGIVFSNGSTGTGMIIDLRFGHENGGDEKDDMPGTGTGTGNRIETVGIGKLIHAAFGLPTPPLASTASAKSVLETNEMDITELICNLNAEERDVGGPLSDHDQLLFSQSLSVALPLVKVLAGTEKARRREVAKAYFEPQSNARSGSALITTALAAPPELHSIVPALPISVDLKSLPAGLEELRRMCFTSDPGERPTFDRIHDQLTSIYCRFVYR